MAQTAPDIVMRILSTWLFGAGLAAQGTFVVDAQGGPGSQFADLQTAVQTVPSGSVLVVRAGDYSEVHIDGKGLSIVCAPGVQVLPPFPWATQAFLRITNTLPTQVVAVSGLGVSGPTHHGIQVANAQGLVVLDGLGMTLAPSSPPTGGTGATLTISDSTQVVVRRFELRGGTQDSGGFALPYPLMAVAATNSSVLFENCTLRGSNSLGGGHLVRLGKSALSTSGGSVEFVQTRVFGGDGWSSATWLLPPGPIQVPADAAITSDNTQWSIRGSAQHPIAGGTLPAVGTTLPAVQLPAITGTGALRIDPAIPVVGPIDPGLPTTTAATMRIDSDLPVVGGTATATVSSRPGLLTATLFGLPAAASTLPGLADPLWIDFGTGFVVGIGTTDANGRSLAQLQLPNLPLLRGLVFVWQAAHFDGQGITELTNRSVVQVR